MNGPRLPPPRWPVGELARLARRSLETALDAAGEPPGCPTLPGDQDPVAGVFVTLWTRRGELRGCVGTVSPKEKSVAAETWRMAREAAFGDSRFSPVTRRELPDLTLEVSVLGPPVRVRGHGELDPQRYGVVVRTSDGRRGVLLPQVEGIETVGRQLEVARHKAGIGPHEAIQVERFVVEAHGEFPVRDRGDRSATR